LFHVIDLKHEFESSVTPQWPAAANELAARCMMLHPIGGV